MSYKKLCNKKTITAVAIVIVIAVALFISLAPKLNLPFSWDTIFVKSGLTENVSASEKPFSVHFIDVGQGDCALVKSGDSAMLIDCGESGNADKILAYLKEQNVESIDYLIATHPHSDHIGSMADVIEGIEVKNIIMPRLSEDSIPTTKTYERLLKVIGKSGAKVIAAKQPTEYTFSGATVTILGPISQTDELNNMSVICRVNYNETSFIFMGDAETVAEKELVESGNFLSSDVIKIGHHGSRTSSSEALLKKVNPTLAVISCGKDNSYNHPHEETLERLEKMGVDYKRTDLNGTIVVGSDGKSLTITQEKE